MIFDKPVYLGLGQAHHAGLRDSPGPLRHGRPPLRRHDPRRPGKQDRSNKLENSNELFELWLRIGVIQKISWS